MPEQDSLPVLVGCLVAAGFFAWLWRMAGQAIWLVLALAVGAVGIAAATVYHLTITDREELELLLPRLAWPPPRRRVSSRRQTEPGAKEVGSSV